jgi:hypothetical protein
MVAADTTRAYAEACSAGYQLKVAQQSVDLQQKFVKLTTERVQARARHRHRQQPRHRPARPAARQPAAFDGAPAHRPVPPGSADGRGAERLPGRGRKVHDAAALTPR